MTSHITTPFGAESTAADVIAGVDLSGKTAIVTGASSGIGVETARALAGAGAAVTLAVRDTAAGDRVAAEIRAGTGNTSVSVGALDLSDLTSVAAFVRAWTGPLDILAISKDKKRLLVVELKKGRASDAVVGQTLRYMSFVQEMLAEKDQAVHGIIIALEDDQKIHRALAMVSNVKFCRYQVNFRLIGA